MMMTPSLILCIVFPPLIGSLIAGLGGKYIGRSGAHWITIIGVVIAMVSSALLLNDVLHGFRLDQTAYVWAQIGQTKTRSRIFDRSLICIDGSGSYFCFVNGTYLYHRVHARRSWLSAFL